MRSLVRLGMTVALITGLVAAPGAAQEPDPIDMTLFLHAEQKIGEAETSLDVYRRMDEEEPVDEQPASVQVTNYGPGPNTNCSGNGLTPTFEALLEGRVSGDVTVTLHTASIPGAQLEVRLFADTGTGACNESFTPPIAEAIVNLTQGVNETVVVLPDVDAAVGDTLVLMVNAPRTNVAMPPGSPVGAPLQPFSHSRLFYDSVEMPSRVELSCVPLTADVDTCLWG